MPKDLRQHLSQINPRNGSHRALTDTELIGRSVSFLITYVPPSEVLWHLQKKKNENIMHQIHMYSVLRNRGKTAKNTKY